MSRVAALRSVSISIATCQPTRLGGQVAPGLYLGNRLASRDRDLLRCVAFIGPPHSVPHSVAYSVPLNRCVAFSRSPNQLPRRWCSVRLPSKGDAPLHRASLSSKRAGEEIVLITVCTFNCCTPLSLLVGVSIGMEKGCQQAEQSVAGGRDRAPHRSSLRLPTGQPEWWRLCAWGPGRFSTTAWPTTTSLFQTMVSPRAGWLQCSPWPFQSQLADPPGSGGGGGGGGGGRHQVDAPALRRRGSVHRLTPRAGGRQGGTGPLPRR